MDTADTDVVEPADPKLFQGTLFNPSDTEIRRCPRRTLTVWRIESAVSLVWTTLGLMIPVWLIALLWQEQSAWWLAAPLALTVPWYAWSFFRLRTTWRLRGYWLGPQELWVRGGLGHRYLSVAPYGRIQECTVSSTFWSRQFKLASVDISIGAQASLTITDVEPEEAEKVAHLLRSLALERGVQL